MTAQTAYYPAMYGGPSRSYGTQRTVRVEQPYSLFNGYSANDHRQVFKVTSYDDDTNSVNTNTSSLSQSGGVSAAQATPSFQLVRKASIRSPPSARVQPNNPFRIDIYSVGVVMESKMTGTRFDPQRFKVEAEAPSGRVIRMAGDGHYSAQFTPDEIGRWRVSMYYNGKFMDGCPVDVCDPSQVRVRELRGGHVGKQQTFHVDCTGAGQGEVGVIITHKGKRVTTNITETSTPRLYKVTFTPYDPGPYEVNVLFNKAEVRDSDFQSTDPEERQRRALFNTSVTETDGVVRICASCDWEIDYVTGGPFIVHATDSSDVEVYGMKDGTICSNPELIVDCTKVGEGHVTADVTHDGMRYPCKVRPDQRNTYRVSFKPRGPGVYKIWVNYDGSSVKGSPFVQEIAELGNPVAFGDGLVFGVPGRPQTFTVDPRGHPGHITADVAGPLENVPCQLTPQSDGTLLGQYVPRETGTHNVDIRLQGKPIEGSPFKPRIVDPGKVRVPGGWTPLVDERGIIPLHVNKEKLLPFDASEAGVGELNAEVRGPSGRVPVAVDARHDGKQTVIFTPREEGKHYIDVKWCGFPLANSPYEGYATKDPELVEIQPQRQVQVNTRPPEVDKEIIPLTVGQKKELPFETSHTGPGQLTARVRGPNHQIPVDVVDQVPGKSSLFFTPQEEGKHLIDVDWNGQPLATSPLIGYAAREPTIVYQTPVVSQHVQPVLSQPKMEDKDIIPLKVNKEKQIAFDTSNAGPGRMTATVRGPTHTVSPTVDVKGDDTHEVRFTPKEEGKHYIDVNWNGTPLPQSPLLGYATRDPEPNGIPNGPAPVYLQGHYPRDDSPDDTDIIPLKVNHVKTLPFDATRAGIGKLTGSVQGPTRPVPVSVEDNKNGRPTMIFTPEEEGKHNINVNWNGRPIAHSPLLGYAVPDDTPRYISPPPVFLDGHDPKEGRPYDRDKDIIPLKVDHAKHLPFDATEAGPGKLTGSVQGPSRPVPATVQDNDDGRPILTFTPEEEGKHDIEVNWSGRPIPSSPLTGYAVPDDPPRSAAPIQMLEAVPRFPGLAPVHLAGYNPKGGRPYDGEKDIIPLKVDHVKHLPFDATEAGPGTLTAKVRGPNKPILATVDDLNNGKPTVTFVPEEEGKHLIDVDWNGYPIPRSPFVGYATRDPVPVIITPQSSRPPSVREDPDVSFRSSVPSLSPAEPQKVRVLPTAAPVKVVLSGKGLKEAEVDKPAYFNVDGTQAPPGRPTAHLEGVKTDIPVHSDPVRPQVYRCNYVPKVPGAYKLHVKWNDQPLRGSPFKVNVRAPPRQQAKGIVQQQPRDSLPLRSGQDFSLTIDHPDTNQLNVKATDPKNDVIPHRFLDNLDGTHSLKLTPKVPGRHRVDITENNRHIMGSPYYVDISLTEENGRVRVWGPGIQRGGVLYRFQSHFFVDTTGAGAGELKVRIMGPKGSFKVKMQRANPINIPRDSKPDKVFQAFYDPVEQGIYTIYVQWSGQHVDGSPFTVVLAQTDQELALMQDEGLSAPLTPPLAPMNGSPRDVRSSQDFLY